MLEGGRGEGGVKVPSSVRPGRAPQPLRAYAYFCVKVDSQ